jgi:hypothetical protein
MNPVVTHETLHRGAKYFMDNGRVASHEEALDLLRRFGLYIEVGPEIAESRDHQIALLTLVNCARRTLLGGVHVIGVPEVQSHVRLTEAIDLPGAVEELGGRVVARRETSWPCAVIGTASSQDHPIPSWQLTWSEWGGGVTPLAAGRRLDERRSAGIAPALAAASCAAEVFQFHAADHPLAGRRSSGMSLWRPGSDWLVPDPDEPQIQYLPAALWLIGLGNLGQAYLWLLSCLEYRRAADLFLMLQDEDRLAVSNDSTSLLSSLAVVDTLKTRAMAAWLERRGFRTALEERKFGEWCRRATHEPAVALCGVDNALARRDLEKAGFGLVIETGLGAGVHAFKNFSMHVFPGSLCAATLWGVNTGAGDTSAATQPAYDPKRHPELDECGLHQLASRTIGVPFVGLTAAAVAISEMLRRLHGGAALDLLSGSLAALEDVEALTTSSDVFEFGYANRAA